MMDLNKLDVPAWLPGAAADLVEQAERLFVGPKRGAERKAWVADQLKMLARKRDIQAIPNWVENAIEPILIDSFVEFAFALISRQIRRIHAQLMRESTR